MPWQKAREFPTLTLPVRALESVPRHPEASRLIAESSGHSIPPKVAPFRNSALPTHARAQWRLTQREFRGLLLPPDSQNTSRPRGGAKRGRRKQWREHSTGTDEK